MKLYNFNRNSILNTALVRIINAVIFCSLLLMWFSSTFHWNIKTIEGHTLCIAVIYVIVSTINSISIIWGRNKWCEIDKKEAKRKESFIISYCALSILFTILIAITALLLIKCHNNGGSGIVWRISTLVYLLFNRLNICSLFNFNDYFGKKLPYYNCEDLDIIKHVLARDHFIYLDELIWDSRRFRGIEKEEREG